MYNHPFWFAIGDRPNLWTIPELIKQFPVVEYKIQNVMEKNLVTSALARKYGIGLAVTTDSHTGGMWVVYTLAKGESFREYFENIKNGKSYIVVEGGTRRHLTKELSSGIELVFSTDGQPREDLDFTTQVCSFDRIISLFAMVEFDNFQKLIV